MFVRFIVVIKQINKNPLFNLLCVLMSVKFTTVCTKGKKTL